MSPARHVEDFLSAIQAVQPVVGKDGCLVRTNLSASPLCPASCNGGGGGAVSRHGCPRDCAEGNPNDTDGANAVAAAARAVISSFRCRSLALWGTSLAGGHVIVAAAEPSAKIDAVVSQVI